MADQNSIRSERIKDRIQSLAAKYIATEASRQSLITVTGCLLSDDSKEATILISVLPEDQERPALAFIKHHLQELRGYIKKNSGLGVLPYLHVDLDYGEKNRQKIDDIISADKKKDNQN